MGSTIFDIGEEGRTGLRLPPLDLPERNLTELIPADLIRKEDPKLPQVSQIEVVRHYTRLSRMNYGVDNGIYPLGSCTMKYNPRINEEMARLPQFAHAHPLQGEALSQGILRLMYELGELLCAIGGMDAITLQPAAGAHGELVGMLLIKKHFERAKELHKRTKILLPDSAHGTNPASAAMCGFEVVHIPSDARGLVDLEALKAHLDESVAGIMLTNPNTLGLFETEILEITRLVHDVGGLVYYDGANLNAIVGRARPGDMGVDIVHYNLHKTFSTPHGGGGPGAGPVAVVRKLAPYLPVPVIAKKKNKYVLDYERPHSVGRVHSFYGNVAVLVRAYTYIRMMGEEGLRAVSTNAVLNANYLRAKLRTTYKAPYDRLCMHEFVITTQGMSHDLRTLDVAKRLIDYGVHPSSIYFPLIVPEVMMIEPTETVSKEELDRFAEALLKVAQEMKENPQILKEAPHAVPVYGASVRRLDEVRAAKEPILRG
ncbi:MAG: aminomethyl-transferring glycine dehydrogenase subunit GcvPB [Candidatus Bipolaricaulota bacterium]|nr:aminomethyl-transferring glycine dehydrogenase subunit GcvPB [Candidatus Bipolaricaulota bacterium]MDW8110597.1 aminomethyl-transferring glycine dehydrogenase subunit GcvPB [Candidatus Bipolaricaulota bacterium]MDW8329491.1 aminomethyl-transferring glycine dehydrogenase subunit GcvPB [Candidatus Bipolaricaulota bacterium]